jgi:hypothetical protein
MKYYYYLFLFLFALSYHSCTDSNNQKLTFNKDAALKQYLLTLESLPYFDTTDKNYKVMKAYQNNDSSFFMDLENNQKREIIHLKSQEFVDSSLQLKKLESFGAEHAYRFSTTSSFEKKKMVVTVTKKGDAINLHLLVYHAKYDSMHCNLIIDTKIDKKLSSENWNDFYNKLMYADIWGLKRENGIGGNDGGTLTFIAYENDTLLQRFVRQCYIYRWGYSSLGEPFHYLITLSGYRYD